MYMRKLVKSGATSHTISLPRNWIKRNRLKKGDMLYINEDGTNLVITPQQKEEAPKTKEITITIDNKRINAIRREVISAYINNFNIFNIIGQSLNDKLEEIRKILNNFLALEIIEQTNTKIVAKDFLNLKEFSVKNTIRRMDMITRSIMSDSKEVKKNSYLSLCYRDYEVDKLYFLISRLIRSVLTDHKVADQTKISPVQALSIWYLAKNIEKISDCSKNVAQQLESLNENAEIIKFYSEIEKYYQECIKAYFTYNKELADSLIETKNRLMGECNNKKPPIELKQQFKIMIDHIKNIAKIVLDYETE